VYQDAFLAMEVAALIVKSPTGNRFIFPGAALQN
jgi:hypothetical protein